MAGDGLTDEGPELSAGCAGDAECRRAYGAVRSSLGLACLGAAALRRRLRRAMLAETSARDHALPRDKDKSLRQLTHVLVALQRPPSMTLTKWGSGAE